MSDEWQSFSVASVRTMSESDHDINERPSKDPLHGVTLEMVVTRLAEQYGWEKLAGLIPIKCFTHQPSIKSSLKFLRRTPWAREKVERLYINTRSPPPTDRN